MTFEIETVETYGQAIALRALRRPMNKIPPVRSFFKDEDIELGKTLVLRGPDHAKFTRLMGASFTIRAPRYWWIEFATYRVGVESVSESTMHRKLNEPFVKDDFELELSLGIDDLFLEHLNRVRENVRGKGTWTILDLKQRIPEGFLQTRDVSLSYQAMRNIYFARRNHKLPHWRRLCTEFERLPFSTFITVEQDVAQEAAH